MAQPMREFEFINTTPTEEECIQLGNPNYETEAKLEIDAFIRQLKRQIGEPPYGVELKANNNSHDFGMYYDIRISFNDQIEEQVDYVSRLTNNLPDKWDKEALEYLQQQRMTLYNSDNPILKIA